MSYNPQNPNGQATMANSAPVAIASNQASIPTAATLQASSGTDIGKLTANQSVNVNQIAGGTAINSGVTGAQAVGGDTASAATDAGNPVKVGAKFNSTPPTFTDGQRGDLQIDARGNIKVALFSPSGTVAQSYSADNADAVATSATANKLSVQSRGTVYNGSTWDRTPGTTAGAYSIIRDAAGNARGANVNASNQLSVSVDAALPAGANAIGKLAANSGVTIGAVEIAASQTLATLTTLTGGGVAHDGGDSGNPVKVGAKASATLSDDTMVSNGDRTDMTSDVDGAVLVRQQFPLGDLLSERVSNTDGNSTAFTNFSNTASTRNYVTSISLFNSSATAGYVDFRDGTGGSVLYTVPIPAGGGAVMASDLPLFRTSTNTALAFDVSAALTTVYISISGFKSKV